MKSLVLILLVNSVAVAQSVSTNIPKEIQKDARYIFYLHGGVVTALGNNAVNQSMPEWGPYEYLNILDSLRKRGFNVISENRKEGIDDSVYVNKIKQQIDTLFHKGVRPERMLLIGASAGADIAIHVSSKLKNKNIKFVIMGACWPDTYKTYLNLDLYGKFLSIIEKSDPHGTCNKIFEHRKKIGYSEIELNTGLSHGFLYKGYKEWIDPIVKWQQSLP